MDIIERLNDPEMYVDATDDAINEIITLRERVKELERFEETPAEREFLQACIRFFGPEKQLTVLIEEMAELTQALCKMLIDHPKRDREKVVEEWVDVKIMMRQARMIFNITDEEIKAAFLFKINRLKNRIEGMPDEDH